MAVNTGVAADRAKQLAAVAMAVHDAGGRGSLQLPMTPQHKLVAALQGAATQSGGGTSQIWSVYFMVSSSAQIVHGCLATAVRLLLPCSTASWTPSSRQARNVLPPLHCPTLWCVTFSTIMCLSSQQQALNALSLADAAACIPAKDPGRVVRCLAPHVRAGVGDGDGPEARRDAAAVSICTISIIDRVLEQLGHCVGCV